MTFFQKHLPALIFFLLIHVYFILSNVPLYILHTRNTADTVFPLYHSPNPYDYNVYLSVITQGKNGQWLMKDAYTTEKTNPTLFYFYYILLGKIAALLSLPSYLAYHLGRIVSFEIYAVGLYTLTTFILGKWRGFLAAAIATIGTISPLFLMGEKNAFVNYFPWWGTLEALNRVDGLPHYLFGYGLLFFSLILIFKSLEKRSTVSVAVLLVLIFLGGIIFPPSLLPIVIGLPASFALYLYLLLAYRKKITKQLPKILLLLVIVLVGLAAFGLIWRENYNGFPWGTWSLWERSKWNTQEPNFNRALAFSFGILPLFAFLPIWLTAKKPDFRQIFLTVWAFIPFMLLPFIDMLGLSKFRLISIAPFVPLGMLTSISVFKIGSKSRIGGILACIVIIATTIPVTFAHLRRNVQYSQTANLFSNIFLPVQQWKAISYLQTNAPKNSVVLSNEYLGIIIPAHTPLYSYFAHPVHTMHFFEKQQKVARFYSQTMKEDEAKDFLTTNNIKYVFFGPDERMGSQPTMTYPFLKAVFSENDVILYEKTT